MVEERFLWTPRRKHLQRGSGGGFDNPAWPETPRGVLIDTHGCSGAQRVNLLCPEATFPNHGKYVSCVAKAANDAKANGLLTQKERARIVSQAAKKSS